MNITVTNKRPDPVLISAADVPIGRVYSWGPKNVSYLRIKQGSICLGDDYSLIPRDSYHFGLDGPRVQVAEKADLTLLYEV